MNMIKNLIYDFGRVLVTYDFEHISSFGFASEEDLQSFVNIVSDPAFVRRCDLELIPFEDLIREMQHTYPQWKEQWQLFYDRYLEFVTGEMPGMHAYMTELKARGYKLYGLSNWCSTIYRVMKEYKIFNLLDGFVVSSDYQVVKPDPAIYRILLDKYDLKAEECIFADDRADNVEAAQQVGMQAIVFTTTEAYKEALEPLLVGNEDHI